MRYWGPRDRPDQRVTGWANKRTVSVWPSTDEKSPRALPSLDSRTCGPHFSFSVFVLVDRAVSPQIKLVTDSIFDAVVWSRVAPFPKSLNGPSGVVGNL